MQPRYFSVMALHYQSDQQTLASLPPKKERCLPNGQVAIVINLGHDTLRVSNQPHAEEFQSFHGAILHGAFSEFSVIDTTTLVTTKTPAEGANLSALSDLCTPWCVHVVATLRIADHIAAGTHDIKTLASPQTSCRGSSGIWWARVSFGSQHPVSLP